MKKQDMFYSELHRLYERADEEANVRKTHKEMGWDEYDKLYRSHIVKDKWPFASRIFMPTAFASLIKKDTRLIASKLTGKLVPMEEGQELGAMVGTELLHAQWDDVDYHESEPMLMRIFRWSQMARKYGDGYVWAPWKKDGTFDGPTMEVIDRQNVLTLAGSNDIQEGVFIRSYPTLQSLYDMNDTAVSGPIYDPAVLRELEEMGSDNDDFTSVNRDLRGLGSTLNDSNTGMMGKSRRVTVIKYRSRKRWVDFVPNKGSKKDSKKLFILRDIANPYKHGQVPLVPLVYYPIDDDIAGVSEFEPVRTLMKALNALVCNYMDSVNIELFPIMKGKPTDVQYKTVEYKARAVWIMNNPQTDLVRLEHSNSGLSKFIETYKMLVGAINEALGESTAEASGANPFAQDKTATEIKDTALLRSARDNFNRLALMAAISKVIYYWWEMDKQFLTSSKIIRVVGKEAIEFFVNEGLNEYALRDEGYQLIEAFMEENPGVEFEDAYEALREQGILEEYATPLFPSQQGQNTLPKLQLDRSGKTGFLSVEQKDLTGKFRYMPDIESLSLPNDQEKVQSLMMFFDKIVQVQQQLDMTGDSPRYKDLLAEIGQKLRLSNVEQFFGAGEGMAAAPTAPGQMQTPMQPGMQMPVTTPVLQGATQ